MADNYKILTIPFARDAVPDMVNVIPDSGTPSEPGRASWEQGFPYITTIPLVASGVPPQGQDFNGILKEITEHIVHQNKGGMYKFSDTVVASGGYPKGAVLVSDDGLTLYISLIDGNDVNFNTESYSGNWFAAAGKSMLDLTEGAKSYKIRVIRGSLALEELP